MEIAVVPSSRRLGWPGWAIGLVAAWAGLGMACVALSQHLGRPVALCLFKRLTHLPCPTCGATRGALSLLGGDVARAWLYNPLAFSAAVVAGAAVAFRVVTGRRIRIGMGPRERRLALCAAIGLVLANWIYVILKVG